MGTRATYQIEGKVFYIHWDGYPQGASFYFHHMIEKYNEIIDKIGRTRNGGYAEAFLRGNDCAEFTSSHDAHGDTEWQYTLEGDELTVAELYCNGNKISKNTYTINLFDFIAQNYPAHDLVKYTRKYAQRPQIITKTALSTLLGQKEALKRQWIGRDLMKSANGDHLQAEIDLIEEALKS